MNILRRVKTKVQDNLPLSSKLFLKRALSLGARPINRIRDHRRGLEINKKRKLLRVPEIRAEDLLTLKDALAEKQNELAARTNNVCASIIIPVFDRAAFTFQCLKSLLGNVDFSSTEIIVLKNPSAHETSKVLTHFGNFIRVIENDENHGFADACNQGAAAARGKYLVFLNSATMVQQGWLKHLLATVEGDESVGAVGSMFLNPDDSIREAGAVVWNTGEAYKYGRGKSPDDHRFNFVREVDYCSGGSLLIRKHLFARLGGFDRRYAPADYEDVDLCFGVRSLGYKVLYQPASRILYFGGATAGPRTGAGKFQPVGRKLFVEKWGVVLQREHYPKNESNPQIAANRNRGKEVIVFDDVVPTPDRDAGGARMLYILKTLSRHSKPVFVYKAKPMDPAYERLLWQEGIETAPVTAYTRLLRDRGFKVAIFSRPEIAKGLLRSVRRRKPGIKIIFDMVDAYFVRLAREYSLTADSHVAAQASRYKQMELQSIRASDLVWCASSADKAAVAREVPNVPIEVVPTIHPLRSRGKSFAEREHLFFVGNFGHRPNVDGVVYFLKEVFPLVRRFIPGVKVFIAGAKPPLEIQALGAGDVDVMGYVLDIEPFLNGARVFVAPLRFGAGMKGKVGDALSYGLPVVTTSIGAEGMGVRHGQEVMIADDPTAFAEAVVDVYRDAELWQRLSDNGCLHVERNFSPQAVEQTIVDSINLKPQ